MHSTPPLNRLFFCLIAVLMAALPPARAQEPKTVRLLTVGNSFAENALAFLPKITESAGHKLIFAKANLGGCSLERHWKHAAAYEANHDDPAGRPYAGGKTSLAELLKQDRWDFVTIQQQSLASCDFETFVPFGPRLHDYIKTHCPSATILAHQTWAYRVDDSVYRPKADARTPKSHQEMYQRTRAAYLQLAEQLKIGRIPSGEAMYKADTDAQWGYRPDSLFDFANAKPPAMPDQKHSLHTGWSWKTDKATNAQKLAMDGRHASVAGQYLIGCVWYGVLFKEDVTKVTFAPNTIDAQYARFLRQTARDAVAEVSRPPGK